MERSLEADVGGVILRELMLVPLSWSMFFCCFKFDWFGVEDGSFEVEIEEESDCEWDSVEPENKKNVFVW